MSPSLSTSNLNDFLDSSWSTLVHLAQRHCKLRHPVQSGVVVVKSIKLAEREGFEPSVPCGTLHFQCSAIDHSATSPLLPARRCIKGRAGGGSRAFKIGIGAGVGVGVGLVEPLTGEPVGQGGGRRMGRGATASRPWADGFGNTRKLTRIRRAKRRTDATPSRPNLCLTLPLSWPRSPSGRRCD